ncbi:VIT and VWA domain-containing protein [Colwellia sp. MB02u-14]|uniref:VIT and vWA domain-containing protein n=1 Tax=Colwellia sp. MB02u-14 TaxID=2759815 RepID=UPI0015F5F75B|nr:VIT and VWA domain-containing protein [Colwellia sp. MB02u-14]MBA6304942.1 VWA domain-containing protein [Colwellia sp. MB02u-14]
MATLQENEMFLPVDEQQSLLSRLEADITITHPFAITELKQVFHNSTTKNIEGIYQFPLPKESGFVAFETILNGTSYNGVIKASKEAESNYEEAISECNTAILLEQLGEGIFQINIGNLAPDDKVEFKLTIATMLEQSSEFARYFLPTVIAPKYGENPFKDYHSLTNDFFAEYQFLANITVEEELVNQKISCPLKLKEESIEGKYCVDGFLDQDFTMTFSLPSNMVAKALYTKQENEYCAIASFPTRIELPEKPANVQVVVDCSGSMGGRSIEQVKLGLTKLFNLFDDNDKVNLIKFGSHIEQVVEQWQSFEGKAKSQLRRSISMLNADMGGTELFQAVSKAIENAKKVPNAEILLLTDGEVWGDENNVDSLVNQAMKAECRVSVIGLGSSVNESFLNTLASRTHGELCLINPSENTAAKVELFLKQMKAVKGSQKLTVGFEPSWQKIPNKCLSYGVSNAFYMTKEGLAERIASEQTYAEQSHKIDAHWQLLEGIKAKALKVIVANQRMLTSDRALQCSLAEKYQQVSEFTSFIMVAERDKKSLEQMPQVEHIPQMLSVCESSMACVSYDMDNYLDIPAFMRKSADGDLLQDSAVVDKVSSTFSKIKNFCFGNNDVEFEFDVPILLKSISNLVELKGDKITHFDLGELNETLIPGYRLAELIELFKQLEEDLHQAYFAELLLILSERYGSVLSKNTEKTLQKALSNLDNEFVLEQDKINDLLDLFIE